MAYGADYVENSSAEAGLPPIKRVSIVLDAADIAALSGGSKVLLPGIPNVTHFPIYAYFAKSAGTAWTLNGVTAVCLRYTDGGGAVAVGAVTTGLMDQTTAATVIGIGPGNPTTALYVGLGSFGLPLVAARVAGTNLSGGTGTLQIVLFYRDFPFNP